MFIHTVTDEEYALIGGDLSRAGRLLDALQATENTPDQRVIREALTLAAIVSYCRPFKASRDADGQRRYWIPQQLVDDLPAENRLAHDRLVKARDQAWAHTDWAAHTPRSYPEPDGLPSVMSRNPWIPMDGVEIAEFQSLIGAIEARVQPSSAASDG